MVRLEKACCGAVHGKGENYSGGEGDARRKLSDENMMHCSIMLEGAALRRVRREASRVRDDMLSDLQCCNVVADLHDSSCDVRAEDGRVGDGESGKRVEVLDFVVEGVYGDSGVANSDMAGARRRIGCFFDRKLRAGRRDPGGVVD